MRDQIDNIVRCRVAAHCLASFLIVLAVAPPALAEEGSEDRLGGHIGLVFPWTVIQDGDSTEIWDTFSMGIPMGITVKNVLGPVAFDMELVPEIDEHNNVDVTIHPGLIYPTSLGAFGLRAAFVVDGDAVGFTPLFARPLFQVSESSSVFLELDLPVRFPKGDDTVVAIATHVGISF